MYKHEGGFIALYRGIIPTVAGVAPYVCLNEIPWPLPAALHADGT